jgi:long-subunit acyl-CoA synthetase (AMP-forming)
MLSPFQTYEEALSKFRWEFPEGYNMGWDACDKWVDVEPDRTAIIDLTSGNRIDVSFSELKSKSNHLSNLLISLDIAQGDRVGVFRSQSVWTAAIHLAVWKIAGISMPLFKLFGEEALLSRVNDSGAKVIITDTDGADTLKALRDKLPKLKHIIVPELLAENAQPDEFEIAKTRAINLYFRHHRCTQRCASCASCFARSSAGYRNEPRSFAARRGCFMDASGLGMDWWIDECAHASIASRRSDCGFAG